MNKWVLGGGAVLAVLLLSNRKAAAAPMVPYPTTRDRDLDALADMLITETSFATPKAEMAQIVWIAYNRAKRKNNPIWFVVQPGDAPSPVWNEGPIYRQRFENARKHSRWLQARDFAEDVLAGAYPNLGKTSFVHPGHANFSMPCNTNIKAVRDGKWSPSYVSGYGTRCIPTWAHGGTVVGSALFS
jgi:hypothetical protein